MMKKTKLGLAVTAALSLGFMAQTAQAVNIANNGIGEVAYVPYFSTKDGKQTYVRFVNNGFDTLAVKLKVREGTNSVDARDFHIFLSPRDVWTGKIYQEGDTVRVQTTDTSCTVPSKGRGGWRNDGAAGWSINVPAVGATGSTEGYVVAQVMGTSKSTDFNPFDDNADVASLVKHAASAANGGDANQPRDCAAVSAAFDLKTTDNSLNNVTAFNSVRSQFTEPSNALSGSAAIVNPNNSTLTDLPLTVLANATNPGATGVDGTTGYAEAGPTDFPNDTIQVVAAAQPDETTAVSPAIATIFDDFAGDSIDLGSLNTLPASAALMRSSVANNIDTTVGNSWVITFPTKKHHQGTPCSAPFPADCQPDITTIQHSVRDKGAVSYVTNEEESEFAPVAANQICFSGPDFASNCPLDADPNKISLPHEVNVVTMGAGNALNSALNTAIPNDSLRNIVFGWAQLRFTDAVPVSGTDLLTNNATTLNGLPVIGFGYTEYRVGSLLGTMSQAHTYTSPLSK